MTDAGENQGGGKAGEGNAGGVFGLDSGKINEYLKSEIEGGGGGDEGEMETVTTDFGEIKYRKGDEVHFEEVLGNLIAEKRGGGKKSEEDFNFGDPEYVRSGEEHKTEDWKPGSPKFKIKVDSDEGVAETLQNMYADILENLKSAMTVNQKNILAQIMGMAEDGERMGRVSQYEQGFLTALKKAGLPESELTTARSFLMQKYPHLIQFDAKKNHYSYKKGALEAYAKEATPAIQNKLGQFTSNPLIRNIIGQPHSSFDLRKMMDERKILIVNLSKGQLGEGNANLLGGMIITKIYLAAMSRADLTEGELKKLPNFYMYVDEFQSFANESFADILSEARKYKLALVVAHQYIKQMDEKVADAVFGNVGTQIMFRVGAPDAEELEKEYAPVFTAEDMVSLGFTQIYLKLMIDGVASHPFSAVTLGPIAAPAKSLREEVITSSRTLYGHPREKVEKDIAEWYGAGLPAATSAQAGNEQAQAPERSAPRADFQPQKEASVERAPVVKRDSNAVFERSSRPERPQARREETPRTEKLEKPFAQAFKNIPKPDIRENPLVQKGASNTVPLSALANGALKSKGPSAGNLGSLKDALAGVLETEKKPAVPTAPQARLPAPGVARQAGLQPVSAPKAVPPQVPANQLIRGLAVDLNDPPKPREVPEDVLTAILRGDD